jgi:hypothetical protein
MLTDWLSVRFAGRQKTERKGRLSLVAGASDGR